MTLFVYFLMGLVLFGTMPILILIVQMLIAGFHGIINHYSKCADYLPRIAILIPAWNEADVLDNTLNKLLYINYPSDRLKIYVIDDASTDATPQIVGKKIQEYPDRVYTIRREVGGEGKCHNLNIGLKHVLSEPWAEAILITDADIEFGDNALQKMTRHLADPQVGAVTCYIKVEYKGDSTFLKDCIASEYILSQAIARRAQNVMKALACLAGGAQIHTRKNIEAIGGQINTTTLAEDTYTTFLTQINHRRAIFEGNAYVRADEPNDLISFWKQRFRWSRGNIQITKHFKYLWFRRSHSSNLGGIFFGLTWFSTMLMPFTMMITSISLILLLFIDPYASWSLFRLFYYVSSFSYITSTLLSFAIDPRTMRKAWFSTLMFPGLISIFLMIISVTSFFEIDYFEQTDFMRVSYRDQLLLAMDIWISGCMFFSWLILQLAKFKAPRLIVDVLIAVVGYGPMLCTITLMAFIAETRKSSLKWAKTEKELKSHTAYVRSDVVYNFEKELAVAIKEERNFMRDEILIIVVIILFLVII